MVKTLLSFLFIFLFATSSWSQIGGTNVFEFLNLSPSARISALGGNLITVRDDDVNLAYANPGLLNPSMHQQLSFSHNFHLAGINHGYVSFANHYDQLKTTFHAGLQYVSYGQFDSTNELGEAEGTFKASEYAFTFGAGFQAYDRLTIGANIKVITSQLESYNSFGITTDLAMVYFDTTKHFTATMLFKNIGTQITTFREGNSEPVPFEIQVGFSKKLRYLPFRLSIIYHHLDRWNILYDDPNLDNDPLFINDNPTERSNSSIQFDNFFRHFIFSGEFLLGRKENLRLRVGYNHLLRKELAVQSFRSLGGFSFGFGIKINRFRLDYGRTSFHLAGGANHLSISTNIKEFRR